MLCGYESRWAQKGLDPKFYHTEADGSNWVLSYASQALLNAGFQSGFQAAPWDLDPNLECDGLCSFPPISSTLGLLTMHLTPRARSHTLKWLIVFVQGCLKGSHSLMI